MPDFEATVGSEADFVSTFTIETTLPTFESGVNFASTFSLDTDHRFTSGAQFQSRFTITNAPLATGRYRR